MDDNELSQLIADEFNSFEDLAASVALCSDQVEEFDFLKSFETGMQNLVEIRQNDSQPRGEPLWIAVNFDPVLAGERLSYRRALKKYTNSIVFEDLGIGLMLVKRGRGVERIMPEEVNGFLRDLDNLIARHRSQKR